MAVGHSIVRLVQRALRNLLSLGGVLGLAISLYLYRSYRQSCRNSRSNRDGRSNRSGQSSRHRVGQRGEDGRLIDSSGTPEWAGRAAQGPLRPPKREGGETQADKNGCASSEATLPQLILSTYKKPSLVISIPSILTSEPGPITFSATAHGPTVAWLKAQLKGWSTFQVYLVCHVEDDVGEAVVSAMLEHCGVVPQVVPAHRVLFVENVKSTVSIVRQLDPGAYLGNDDDVCMELRRFYKERGRIMTVKAICDGGHEDKQLDSVQSRLSLRLWL